VVHVVPNSRNLPAEFAETRYPIMVEQLGLKEDSGGPGFRRGGFGYDKRIRSLTEARLISNADRSVLGCYGVNGGKAGKSYAIAVTSPIGVTADHPGMCDTVVVPPGATVRIVTTGGGGWGDPLLREIDKVVYDVECGLISPASARDDYGVVLSKVGRKWQADAAATAEHRRKLGKSRGKVPMFDRGAHFEAEKRLGRVKYPDGWVDPDLGWHANAVLEQE
jgi:N-methylhydantoinase B